MSLSDKLVEADNKRKDNGFYFEKDVKEAVNELKEIVIEWDGLYLQTTDGRGLLDKIDKIFGEKLI